MFITLDTADKLTCRWHVRWWALGRNRDICLHSVSCTFRPWWRCTSSVRQRGAANVPCYLADRPLRCGAVSSWRRGGRWWCIDVNVRRRVNCKLSDHDFPAVCNVAAVAARAYLSFPLITDSAGWLGTTMSICAWVQCPCPPVDYNVSSVNFLGLDGPTVVSAELSRFNLLVQFYLLAWASLAVVWAVWVRGSHCAV